MTAALAAGDPPPRLNTSATLSSIPEDDEVSVFPADRAPNIAFKTKNNRGTQTHVAHHVTKTPSQRHTAARQHDDPNRSTRPPTAIRSPSSADDEDEGFRAISTHPIHSHLERRSNHCSAATPATTSSFTRQPPTTHHHVLPVQTPSALPTETQPTSTSTSTCDDVLPDLLIAMETFQQRILEEFCSLLKLPMPPTMTPTPSLPPHQADSSPTPPPQIPTLATAPRREPVDLNRQTHRNKNNPDRLTSTPMPQMPTTQLPTPQLQTLQLPTLPTLPPTSLVTNQPVIPPQPPTPFTILPTAEPLRERTNFDGQKGHLRTTQEVDPDLPFAQPASEQYTQPPAQTDSTKTTTHSHTLSNDHTESSSEPTTIDAHSTQPYLSATARLTLNHIRANTTIWIPAVLQRRIPPQPTKHCPHYPDPMNSPFLTTAPTGANNLPNQNDTHIHIPTKPTQFAGQLTCQRLYQHPSHTPVATNVKAFAHNLRPP